MTENQRTIRTFVAVELSDEVRGSLASARDELSRRLSQIGVVRGVRWVAPEGIHLTLKFLGDTPAELTQDIQARLAERLRAHAPFSLQLAGLGVFPGERAPRVIWVGLGGDGASLSAVWRDVEAATAPLGFPTDRRPFSPHLTLARIGDGVTPADRQTIGQVIQSARINLTARVDVARVSLMRSDLSPTGARYTRLFAVPIGPGVALGPGQ